MTIVLENYNKKTTFNYRKIKPFIFLIHLCSDDVTHCATFVYFADLTARIRDVNGRYIDFKYLHEFPVLTVTNIQLFGQYLQLEMYFSSFFRWCFKHKLLFY